MKQFIKSKASALLLLLVMTVSFTACEDDYDYWATENFVGTWRVREVTPYGYGFNYGYSSSSLPYQANDIMRFSDDGTFYFSGYGLNEYGEWGVDRGYLWLDFGGGSYLSGRLTEATSYDYIVIEVEDPQYGYYTLRLTRESYY